VKLAWFDTSEVDSLAGTVVAEMQRRVPPAEIAAADDKSDKRLRRMTEVLSDRARAFAMAERPNLYKRARLGNRVRWALKEAGYPESFVEAFTYELVRVVTLAAKARRA
jgi:hypothetical protein